MDQINWQSCFFLLFALVACIFALAVLFSANIVRMALYLVLSLAATSGLFFLAGADFVGAMQLLIYVGGTLVLLIFGVMLTAQGPFISMKTSRQDWALSAIVGGSLLAILLPAAFWIPQWRTTGGANQPTLLDSANTPPTATPLGMGLLGVRVDRLQADGTSPAGLSGYLLPFEIVSMHLLVVLIGAAYLARAKKRAGVRRSTAELMQAASGGRI